MFLAIAADGIVTIILFLRFQMFREIRGRMLPDPEYHVIALTSAARGALIATGLYFFHEEFDKVDPIISKLVYKSLESHIFDPYLDEFHYTHGHFWLGFGRPTVNNWNTYCNTYVLQAFLLADRDPDRLLRGISQCARSIDRYLDTNKSDGACNEGPSYWNMAAGKVYEYAHIMKECSGGRMDLLSDQQIRNLMGWRSKNYITDGWVVPFGDGYARDDGDKPLLYRLGSEMENPELVDLGIYMTADPARKEFVDTPDLGHDIYRALETLRYAPGFDAAQQAALAKAGGDWDAMRKHLREGVESFWYPQTEHAFLRTASGWFAGVKGGHNAESHNHNDVGSGLLYIGDIPVIIDPGVSTYWNSPLVSYHYWNHESQWHNLPTVNGAMQGSGAKFKAMGTTCDTHANLFRADIATAYPDSALIRKWDRTWSLKEDRLVITDRFKLSGRTRPTVENFITHGPVYLEGETVEGYLVKKGEAIIAARDFEGKKTTLVKLTFPKELIPYTEVRELDDPRFTRSWGSQIHRLQLEAPQNSPLSGTYTFTFKLL